MLGFARRRARGQRTGSQPKAANRPYGLRMTIQANTAPQRVSAPDRIAAPSAGGIGDSPPRPDGALKVTGQFAYGSDLWMDGMLWGATLRSPYPSARIKSVSIGEALATSGVHAVLTHDDVPGTNRYGLEHADQPV